MPTQLSISSTLMVVRAEYEGGSVPVSLVSREAEAGRA